MSLTRYKKAELKDFAEKLALSTEGLKPDLEDRIESYLRQNGMHLEEAPQLSEYFSDVVNSPTKQRNRKSIAPDTSRSDRIVRQMLQSNEDDESEGDVKFAIGELDPLKPLRKVYEALDIGPSDVVDYLESAKKKLLANHKLPPLLQNAPDQAFTVQRALSNVLTIISLSLLTEFAKLIHALIPTNFDINLGSHEVALPDLFVLLSIDRFWKPFSYWLALQVIPLAFAAMINFRMSSTTVARRYRKTKAADPFTFAIAKLILIYFIFNTSWQHIPQVKMLGNVIGRDTMSIGAGVSLLFAIYDAILGA